MLDMITRKEAEAMVRKAVETAVAGTEPIMRQVAKQSVDSAYAGISTDLRSIASRFKGMDGERAVLLVADSLSAKQRS